MCECMKFTCIIIIHEYLWNYRCVWMNCTCIILYTCTCTCICNVYAVLIHYYVMTVYLSFLRRLHWSTDRICGNFSLHRSDSPHATTTSHVMITWLHGNMGTHLFQQELTNPTPGRFPSSCELDLNILALSTIENMFGRKFVWSWISTSVVM